MHQQQPRASIALERESTRAGERGREGEGERDGERERERDGEKKERERERDVLGKGQVNYKSC